MQIWQEDEKIRIKLQNLDLLEYMQIPELDAGWHYITPHIALKNYDAGKIAAIRIGGLSGSWHILKEASR